VTDFELDNRFNHHPPVGLTGIAHDQTRAEVKKLAKWLSDYLPESREKAVAFTKLEEVMFWANAAIARNSD